MAKNGAGNAQAGSILLVVHDFQARSPDELSLAKGDRIELIERCVYVCILMVTTAPEHVLDTRILMRWQGRRFRRRMVSLPSTAFRFAPRGRGSSDST